MARFEGGFNGAGLAHASENLRARCAAEEAEYQRESARIEKQRKEDAEARRQRDIWASALAAEDRGEFVTAKERMEGVGRTKQEAIEYYSALGDIEDARIAHQRQKEFRNFEIFMSERESGDLTVKTPGDEMRAKIDAFRARYGR